MFAKPQKGLVPIGGNWYATPNTPQQPNYSDPFKPSINPIGIDIDLIFDNCNVGLQATGFIGWMNLPSFQFLWHNPSAPCNPPPTDPEPLDDDPYPFPTEPPDPDTRYIVIRLQASHVFKEEGAANGDFDGQFPDGFQFGQNQSRVRKITRLDEVTEDEIFIGKQLIVFPTYIDIYASHVVEWEENYSSSSTYSPNNVKLLPGQKPSQNNHSFRCRTYVNLFYPSIRKNEVLSYNSSRTLGEGFDGQPFGEIQHTEGMIDALQAFSVSRRSWNQLNALMPDINAVTVNGGSTLDNIDNPAYNIGSISQRVTKPKLYLKELPKGDPEPPPPPEKKEKKMCCPEHTALLKLLLKRVGSLPAEVPDNISKRQPVPIVLNSLAEMALWQVRNLDGLMGKYPIDITLEDSDLTKEGNQSIKLEFPNQAEAIAEMIGMLLRLKAESEANLSASVKAMIEAGGAKQAATVGVDVALANAEFLGYELKQKEQQINYSFNPGQQSLAKCLEPSEKKYKAYYNADNQDLRDILHPLMEFGSRWNTQNFRQVSSKSGYADIFRNLIQNPQEVKGKIDELDKDKFSEKLERIEYGYLQTIATDEIDPWDAPIAERPRIIEKKEIGADS